MARSLKMLNMGCLVFLFLSANQAFGQGSAAILPLSKGVSSADASITFYVHNLLDQELELAYSPKCDLDGTEQEGQPCLDVFQVTFDTKLTDGSFKIPPREKFRGELSLKKKDGRYVLYKPVFRPVLPPDPKKETEGVRFELAYQPGYLFILKPEGERLAHPTFDTYILGEARRARFHFDTSKLTMPQVLSVSVKLKDPKTKKMVRFVRLASEKIVDPKRKQLDLEDEFAQANDTSNVCYDAIVQNAAAKDVYELSNCDKP